MAKIIRNFNIDLSSMAATGTTRNFQVVGDSGAIFSLEITNAAGNYYNFSTNTFAATYKRLKNRRIDNGVYNGSITFPTVTEVDYYHISLFAESMHDTVHTRYSEVRFGDGSVDINSSTGSNSNLLKKIIYQYTDVTITLSALAPETLRGTTNFSGAAITNDTITVGRGNTVGKTAFKIIVTADPRNAFQITRQPTINDLVASTTVLFDGPVQIYNEDIWTETARDTDVTNAVMSGTATVTMLGNVADNMKVGDRVTGTGISSTSVVTVSATSGGGLTSKQFTASENVSIGSGVTLTFTPPHYHRWSVTAASSIHKLASGMIYVDSDWPLVSRTAIGPYTDKTTYVTEVQNEDGSIEEVTNTVVNASAPALDPLGYKPTITNGVITKQLGNITFSNKIIGDVDDVNAKVFYAHGPSAIKTIHNTEIKLSDLKVELATPVTTVTSDSTDTTIPVANREGVINNISTISGIGVDTTLARSTDTVDGTSFADVTKIVMDNNVASKMVVGDRVTGSGISINSTVTVVALDPDGDNVKEFSVSEAISVADGITLTFTPYALPIITSGGGASGAGDWTIGTSQVLPQNTVLTVGGTSRVATITGNIEFVNVDDTDFTLYFDIEKFLSAS